jgi:hypothetical protein
MKQLEQTSWGLTAQRIGLSISEETITLHYNVPLNNHSGRINLYYDIPSKTLVFQGQFLGEARERWGEIAAWIKALEQAGLFSAPKTLLQTDQELTFHWNMTPEHLPAALKEYAEMGEWSYVFPGDLIPFFQRQWARWKTLPEKKLLLQAFSQAPTDFVAGLCEAMLSSDFDSSDRSVIETIIKTWKKSSYWKQQQAAQSLEKHPSLKYMAPAPNLPSQMST